MKRLVDALRPGQRVFVPTFSTESGLLRSELMADPERARDVTFCGVQVPGIDRMDYLSVHPAARQECFFMSPAVRAGLAQGRAELLPLDYLGIMRHLRDAPAHDVAIAHLTPPDRDGWCSAGLSTDFLPLVWPRAERRVAHLNPRMPRTRGSFRVHISEIDAAIEADVELPSFPPASCSEVEARIGAHVATLVRDGDTLQFGIGSVPAAVVSAVARHRRLRFHGGMISDAVRTLWESGTLDPDARITTGVVFGDATMHDFAARLDPLWMTDVTHTHGLAEISAIARFVAINSAVEVDLFGQANAERAGGAIQSGAGGLPVFALGAQGSAGGRLLICLGATARQGSVSRIVPTLGHESLCTLPRHVADVVITEHGIAELRGKGLDARANALIGIAAPGHRDALAASWDALRRRL